MHRWAIRYLFAPAGCQHEGEAAGVTEIATGMRVLTVVGDPNQINTWSNTPYFFLQAGKQRKFLDRGLPLQPRKLRFQRLLWNLLRWMRTGETGGFQYSPTFLQQLFAQAELDPGPVEIISHFQLLPPAPWSEHWSVSYYIDATLQQLFEGYGFAAKVGRSVQQAALEQERQNYGNAQRVICMSAWAAQSVVEAYGIPPSKVHVIPGGANLDEQALLTTTLTTAELSSKSYTLTPLRLGFVGKDWQRKGLPFLLQVAEVLHDRAIPVEVIVVGPSIQELPSHPLMRTVGFIDKAQNLQQYVALVRSFHFGCLFSSAEAFGISNLECLRLGVPVLASRVGGIPATVPAGLGILFEPDAAAIEVADRLESFVRHPDTYAQLRDRVAARAADMTWDRTVSKFIQLWQGSEEFSYDAIPLHS